MSILSNPTGRPDRVRALVDLLQVSGGSMTREDIVQWMLPPSPQDPQPADDAVRDTISVAKALGLIETGKANAPIKLTAGDLPLDPEGFAKELHRRLSTTDDDWMVLAAYAYFVTRTELNQGTGWMNGLDASAIANDIRSALGKAPKGKSLSFNPTQYPAWRSWMLYLGLGWDLGRVTSFLADPTERLAADLDDIGAELGLEKAIAADTFVSALSQRYPYLDRGSIFREVTAVLGAPDDQNRLTRSLSHALRTLHDESRLTLEQLGDAKGAVGLSHDNTHTINSFVTVTVHLRRGA